jgi:hypothetical protein
MRASIAAIASARRRRSDRGRAKVLGLSEARPQLTAGSAVPLDTSFLRVGAAPSDHTPSIA